MQTYSYGKHEHKQCSECIQRQKRPQNRGRKRITYLVNNVMVVTNAIHRKPTIDDGGHEEPKTSSMVRRIGRQKKTVMVKK